MDELKKQLDIQVLSNEIVDSCKKREQIIFEDAWCSHNGIVRFTTPFFRTIDLVEENTLYKWNTGDKVMFEVIIYYNSLEVNCVVDTESNSKFSKIYKGDILSSWSFINDDINKLSSEFRTFIESELGDFEKKIQEELNRKEYLEGEKLQVNSTIYERNREARKACLDYYGYVCRVCGADFRKIVSDDFEGIIEVHHIVPISEIGEEYVVDPIKDLIPLCPNCHALIHSKKDGVYTVSELKKIINK